MAGSLKWRKCDDDLFVDGQGGVMILPSGMMFKRAKAVLREIEKSEANLGMPGYRFSAGLRGKNGESVAILPGGVEVRVKDGRLQLSSPRCEIALDIQTGQWGVRQLTSDGPKIERSSSGPQLTDGSQSAD